MTEMTLALLGSGRSMCVPTAWLGQLCGAFRVRLKWTRLQHGLDQPGQLQRCRGCRHSIAGITCHSMAGITLVLQGSGQSGHSRNMARTTRASPGCSLAGMTLEPSGRSRCGRSMAWMTSALSSCLVWRGRLQHRQREAEVGVAAAWLGPLCPKKVAATSWP